MWYGSTTIINWKYCDHCQRVILNRPYDNWRLCLTHIGYLHDAYCLWQWNKNIKSNKLPIPPVSSKTILYYYYYSHYVTTIENLRTCQLLFDFVFIFILFKIHWLYLKDIVFLERCHSMTIYLQCEFI